MRSSSGSKGQWFLVASVLFLFTIFSVFYSMTRSKITLSSEWDDPYFYYALTMKDLPSLPGFEGQYLRILAERIGNETGFSISFSPFSFKSPTFSTN